MNVLISGVSTKQGCTVFLKPAKAVQMNVFLQHAYSMHTSTTAVPPWSFSGPSMYEDQRPKDVDSASLPLTFLGELCIILLIVYVQCRMKIFLWFATSAIPMMFSVVQYVISIVCGSSM